MRAAGDVKFADVPRNAKGRSKGFGLIEYSSAKEAKKAIDTLNDTQLGEREIFVREDREVGYSKGSDKGKGKSKGKSKEGKGKLQVGEEDKGCLVHVGNLNWQ